MPGRVMEVASKPDPCIPIPIIPKRTRSLGATVCGIANRGSGSRMMVLAASVAPAAAALNPRKLRLENAIASLLMFLCVTSVSVLKLFKPPRAQRYTKEKLFLQHFDCHFFEEHNVVVTMILQTEVSVIRTRAALRFEAEFAFGNWLALGVVCYLHAVERNRCVRPVESDFHCVPVGARLSGTRQRFGQRI